jgi:hypothetical protein
MVSLSRFAGVLGMTGRLLMTLSKSWGTKFNTGWLDSAQGKYP